MNTVQKCIASLGSGSLIALWLFPPYQRLISAGHHVVRKWGGFHSIFQNSAELQIDFTLLVPTSIVFMGCSLALMGFFHEDPNNPTGAF